MASDILEYQYYIEGRKIAILSRGATTTYDPAVTTSSELWQTPTVADSDSIMLSYSYLPTIPTTESSTIDVNNYLALALVDYVRHRMFEDQGDEQMAKLYYNKFLAKINTNENNKIGGYRKSIRIFRKYIKIYFLKFKNDNKIKGCNICYTL